MPASPYWFTALARFAMNAPRFALELITCEKYWQPPQPPTDKTIRVPCPLLFAAVTRRWRSDCAPLSQLSPFDDEGVTNAENAVRWTASIAHERMLAKEEDVELGVVDRLWRVAAADPIRVVRCRNRAGRRSIDGFHCGKGILPGQSRRKRVFRVEVYLLEAGRSWCKEARESRVTGVLCRREEVREVGRQAGLTLSDELVVDPCGRDEGGRKNALRRELVRITYFSLQRSKLRYSISDDGTRRKKGAYVRIALCEGVLITVIASHVHEVQHMRAWEGGRSVLRDRGLLYHDCPAATGFRGVEGVNLGCQEGILDTEGARF
jgi:hypothetical protein